MKKVISIEYDLIEDTMQIVQNDFTTFEALGLLEAAKAVLSHDWIEEVKES